MIFGWLDCLKLRTENYINSSPAHLIKYIMQAGTFKSLKHLTNFRIQIVQANNLVRSSRATDKE